MSPLLSPVLLGNHENWKPSNQLPPTLKYQISVPQVIRVPQQKSTLKTGQISWNNRSEDREIANYHSPMHCNSFTCQFKWVKVIFGWKSLRTTGNFGLELIKVPVLLFDRSEYSKRKHSIDWFNTDDWNALTFKVKHLSLSLQIIS